MTEDEGGQVSGDTAEIYEQCSVPAIFGQWGPHMVRASVWASRGRCPHGSVRFGCPVALTYSSVAFAAANS